MGYCSGYCVKKVSSVIAFLVGATFVTLQTLSYNGYVNVDYDKIQKGAEVHMYYCLHVVIYILMFF